MDKEKVLWAGEERRTLGRVEDSHGITDRNFNKIPFLLVADIKGGFGQAKDGGKDVPGKGTAVDKGCESAGNLVALRT